MEKVLKRITVNPAQCAGRPCIRGMRIRVSDILDLPVSQIGQRVNLWNQTINDQI